MDLVYNLLMIIVKLFLKIFFPYKIKGLENVKEMDDKGFLICSNHISNLDALFIIVSLNKKIYFLAKEELFKNPVASYALQKWGAIPISRGNHDTSAIEKAKNILITNRVLTIFIEGTRSKTGKFLRPRSGAAIIANDTNSSIVPVCITPINGKNVKMFHTTEIVFGNAICKINLGENSYREIRDATEMIMNNIKSLRDYN